MDGREELRKREIALVLRGVRSSGASSVLDSVQQLLDMVGEPIYVEMHGYAMRGEPTPPELSDAARRLRHAQEEYRRAHEASLADLEDLLRRGIDYILPEDQFLECAAAYLMEMEGCRTHKSREGAGGAHGALNQQKAETRESAIVEFIRTYTEKHGYGPSRRDIGASVRLGESRTNEYLHSLSRRGLVTSHPATEGRITLLRYTLPGPTGKSEYAVPCPQNRAKSTRA